MLDFLATFLNHRQYVGYFLSHASCYSLFVQLDALRLHLLLGMGKDLSRILLHSQDLRYPIGNFLLHHRGIGLNAL